ncbi:MAG: AAA family ATPase [Eubacteriales bacterium]|nr:AAA family ATPase [Eubacteriales bacterium]
MKLIYCHIENFGRLRNFEYVFSDDVNEICRGNGWGKSTLAAFLCAMFYGLPGSGKGKSSGAPGDRVRFTPWQGGLFGGQLLFETAGREYEVTRFFGKRPSEDTFELRNTETNLPSFDFSEKLGEELFHLNRASFLRTVMIAQQDCETEATDDVNALIGDLADRAGDMGSYASAMKHLTDAANRLTPRRASGSLYRLAAEAAELERETAGRADTENRIRESREIERTRKRKLTLLEAELHTTEERLYAAEETVLKAAQEKAGRQEREDTRETEETGRKSAQEKAGRQEREDTRDTEEIGRKAAREKTGQQERNEAGETGLKTVQKRKARLEGRLAQDTGKARDARQEAVEWKQIYFSGAAGAVILAAGLTAVLMGGTGFGAAVSLIGAVLLAAALLLRRTAENRRREVFGRIIRRENDGQLPEQPSATGRLPARERLPVPEISTVKEVPAAQENLSGQNPPSASELFSGQEEPSASGLPEREEGQSVVEEGEILRLRRKIRGLQEEIISCRSGIMEGEGELQALLADLEEQEEAALRLKELRVRQAKEEQQFRQLTAAASLLAKAKQSLTARYADPVRRAFCGYWETITGCSAAGIRVDAGANVTVEEIGRQRQARELSMGYRDLAGICLRVALMDAMYRRERPPIILDDPFTNLDDEKMEGALRFLREISSRYQILYMTCSRSRCRSSEPDHPRGSFDYL